LGMMKTVKWLRQIAAIEKEEGSNRRETTLFMCHIYIFQCYEIVCPM